MEIKKNDMVTMMYTNGSMEDIMKEDNYINDSISLFIMPKIFMTSINGVNVVVDDQTYLLGDIVQNDEIENQYGLLVKNRQNDKILKEALRVSILNLLKLFIDNKVKLNNIFINRHQFTTEKEMEVFRLIFLEILTLLPKNKYVDKVLIIITNTSGGDCDEIDVND